ncbi:CaiB/BaiF CoA transferase family protein [Lapillicoccus jejuensis]|uniref:Crotonobetainyl-CoA:carnitine CoA-transferase CaiB-like acyl-CoA transferase n=1 Tax=Lapillicoccus jejuensis TaxID=402171 RepID=A0A542E4C5_9MICO|nr:CoA transferase [Lapillicoccus jejuensis]TQJ10202.1 crotonobetainyl-CoA:carnitine CoA-transferase CaiB-like acyl-CoA transferase [Lapillicoccus jejuensis]
MTSSPAPAVPSTDDLPDGPLAGLRVLDLASVVMGPYACQILGDLGADVVKVEPPTGDMTRRTSPQVRPGMSALAMHVNRNKRSLALDLKTEQGRGVFDDLLATADVLVTNMRPAALARLGLDPDTVAERFPRLVLCRAQGFRSDSPLADRAAYDEIVQASSGMVDLVRRATGTPSYVPSILADKVCALTIAYSVLAAVVHQRATGRGQVVEVPMTDTLLAFNLVEHLAGETAVPAVGPTGFPRSMAPRHEAVRTADGWVCLLPYTPRDIASLFRAVGRDDLAADPRFADPSALARHLGDLYALLAELAPSRTTEQWAALCADHSVPFAPVLEVDDAAHDPYVVEGGLLAERPDGAGGTYRSIGQPIRFSRTPAGERRPAPALGADDDDLLRELGYDAARVTALRDAGVLGGPVSPR